VSAKTDSKGCQLIGLRTFLMLFHSLLLVQISYDFDLNLLHGVKHAHAVAPESVISDHMMAPELPEPDVATPSNLRQLFSFPTHHSSSSPCSSCFHHLPPLLSTNRTQATYSQDAPPTTHQASLAEETRIAHIGLANDKPEDDPAPCCMCSALPSPTVPRSGPIRKDLE